MVNDYSTKLPDSTEVSERLRYALDSWKTRNSLIRDVRDNLAGNNTISAPNSLRYKVRTLHTYLFAGLMNEKIARYLYLPNVQVIPTDITPEARTVSSDLEKAIAVAFEEIERHGDGDVWSRVVLDAVTLDQGVERIERAPAAFWSEALAADEDGNLRYIMEGNELEAYTKEAGIPLRSVYVLLESFFPIYEGSTPVETFELEIRSLRSVLRNKSFNTDELVSRVAKDEFSDPNVKVNIIHYCNQAMYAYYALAAPQPATGITRQRRWPDISNNTEFLGDPVLLHSYPHGLGQVTYNIVGGRFGGWKTEENRIEGINKGLMELNARADELISQVLTNVRAKYWPSLMFKIDPDRRPQTAGAPKPPAIPEGEDIALYVNESLEPIFKPQTDDAIPWTMDVIREQMGRLGGSPVLGGGQEPGVRTGYHQALQITQSEHLDDKIEQHLSIGASNRAVLMLKHVKALGKKVFVHHVEAVLGGGKVGEYLSIDPKKLSPLPRMDAAVRGPRPVDFAASLRAAREASDDRGNKGPLLDDDTILQDLLGQEAPDDIKRKIRIQSEENKILESGILTQRIVQLLNLRMATENVPEPGNVDGNSVDPSLQASIGSRQTVGQNQPNSGTSSGVATGQSQPEANAGLEVANALSTAGVSTGNGLVQ